MVLMRLALRVPKTSSVLVMTTLITGTRSAAVTGLSDPKAAVIHADNCARMTRCAVSTGLPRRNQQAAVFCGVSGRGVSHPSATFRLPDVVTSE